MFISTQGMILGLFDEKIPVAFAILSLGLVCSINMMTTISKSSINIGIVKTEKFIIFIFCAIFFIYCNIQGVLFGSDINLLKGIFVTGILETAVACLVFSDKKNENMMCRFLIIVMSLFVISHIISLILSLLVGWDKLEILEFDYNYGFWNTLVFFPFSTTYGYGELGDFTFYRMLGFARECGIMQTFYVWGFYKAEDYFNNEKICRKIKVLMVLGVFLCMSTTGIAIFVFSLGLMILLDKHFKVFSLKSILLILVIICCLIILFGSGTFSLSYRIEVSYSERIKAMLYSINDLNKHPIFGTGFHKLLSDGDIQYSICLLAGAGQIGIVGIILFLFTYTSAFFYAKDKRKFILSNSSFFLTALLAQPIYFYALIYLFLFLDYKKNSISNK